MELTETVESINNQLIEEFGIDTITGIAMFRVVFSEDQLEKRLTYYTDSGMQLIHPEVRMLPKYSQWINQRYVLERLVVVPEVNQDELPTSKLSYEPLWVFESNKGDYLPPTFWACKFTIDTVLAVMGKSSLAKYKENDDKEERINKLQEELFGNESVVGDSLAYHEGIVVPRNYGEN